jgi:signal transduction histidine kinase
MARDTARDGNAGGAGYRVPGWALPGELAAFDGGRPGRRTARDWAADAALFGFAVWYWLWAWHDYVVNPDPEFLALLEDWMVTIDPWVGAAACLALWWRRRFPLALAIAMAAALLVSSTVTGAALVAVFTVAIHRRWLPATLVTAAMVAQGVWFSILYQPDDIPVPVFAVYVVMTFLIPLGWGMMVRFRRQLIVSLRRDAERERHEHAQRLGEARRAERERIAREMHDVLAHRISLLSVHAGALAYRTSQAEAGAGAALTAAEVTDAIRVIRDNAHQALTELGEVLSVLRTGEPDEAGREPPAPLVSDLPRLVAEARGAGQPVTLELDGVLSGVPAPRPTEQRTVYRVVQEGLTNARKHAPGAAVVVRVTGAPGAGLDVTVTNPLPRELAAAEIPGAGAGLTGLAERVTLDGGTLSHGPADGLFGLTAHLPWRG